MVTLSTVGKSIKRQDSGPKLTGQERFTGDLQIPGQLYARPVGAAYAHAMIVSIDASAALAIPGVVAVLTSEDLPLSRDASGNQVKTPISTGEVLYVGHIVALVLAESNAAAEDGVNAVLVEYEPLEAISTIEGALDPNGPLTRVTSTGENEDEGSMHNADAAKTDDAPKEKLSPNVQSDAEFKRGDVAAGFAQADAVIELEIRSQQVHQGYLETQVCLAAIDPIGDMKIYTSSQAAFHVRNKVCEALDLPLHKVDVVLMPVGGGFGGKFGFIESMVAAAAMKVNRPVLLQLTREEDFAGGNPAPDCKINIKLGATKAGDITALESTVVFSAGASGGSPMQIGSILLGGYYRFPNLSISGVEVNLNKPNAGAYRAPGAQQASFAIESAMDEVAYKLGLDPLDFRLRNCVVEGDARPNGNAWPRIGLKEVLETMKAHPLWQNRAESKAKGRGVGIGVGGWPGGVEPATAVCRLDQDGTLTVVLGSSDLNGTNTTFAQIAAEGLGISPDDIRVTTASTSSAPFAGASGGSKITYTVGPAVQKAAEDAKAQILAIAAQQLEASVEDLELVEGSVQVKGVPSSSITLKEIAGMCMGFTGKYDPVYGRGSSSITEAAPGFAGHIAEVEVDELTGEVKITRYVAVQDVGFAINPALVEAQIHGGVAQGIGWALYEGMSFDAEGQLLSGSFSEYALPKATHIPDIEIVLVNVPSEHGPYGAKGIGEPPSIPGPGVIGNAIRNATGVRITNLPITPQQIVLGN